MAKCKVHFAIKQADPQPCQDCPSSCAACTLVYRQSGCSLQRSQQRTQSEPDQKMDPGQTDEFFNYWIQSDHAPNAEYPRTNQHGVTDQASDRG